MSSSTQSFEYYSKEGIMDMLEVLDSSETANTDILPLTRLKVSRIQKWINKIDTGSDSRNLNEIKLFKCVNLQELHEKVKELILPELEIVHYMSLQEITAYETMLIEKLGDIKSDQVISITILLHLKIITNHLMYKFEIFA